MIEAPQVNADVVLHAVVAGALSPREAEWGLVDVLSAAGQDIDADAADLIDTALALLGEWDRGDLPVEDLLVALDKLVMRRSNDESGTRASASRLTRSA